MKNKTLTLTSLLLAFAVSAHAEVRTSCLPEYEKKISTVANTINEPYHSVISSAPGGRGDPLAVFAEMSKGKAISKEDSEILASYHLMIIGFAFDALAASEAVVLAPVEAGDGISYSTRHLSANQMFDYLSQTQNLLREAEIGNGLTFDPFAEQVRKKTGLNLTQREVADYLVAFDTAKKPCEKPDYLMSYHGILNQLSTMIKNERTVNSPKKAGAIDIVIK